MTAPQTQIADMITALEAMDTEDQQYDALCGAIDALGVLKQSFVDEYGKPFVDEYGCSTISPAGDPDPHKEQRETWDNYWLGDKS